MSNHLLDSSEVTPKRVTVDEIAVVGAPKQHTCESNLFEKKLLSSTVENKSMDIGSLSLSKIPELIA